MSYVENFDRTRNRQNSRYRVQGADDIEDLDARMAFFALLDWKSTVSAEVVERVHVVLAMSTNDEPEISNTVAQPIS